MTPRQRPARRAFTLTEVIVSVAILAILSAGVATLVRDLDSRRDSILHTGQANRAASALFDTIENDLLTTFVATRAGEPGIDGSATSLTVRSSAAAPSLDAGTATDPRATIIETIIEFDRRAGVLAAARSAADAAEPEILSTRIADLRFRYHDGERWRSSYDSASENALPVAIECVLLFTQPGSQRGPGDEADRLIEELAADAAADAMADSPAPLGAGPFAEEADDPFAAWLVQGRRRVIAIPDARPTGGLGPGVVAEVGR